jgi:cyclin A
MNVLNFDLVGVHLYEILQQALYMANIPLDNKHMGFLNKITLYLSKMVMFDVDLLTTFDSSTLAAACVYVAFKMIEQVDTAFCSDK